MNTLNTFLVSIGVLIALAALWLAWWHAPPRLASKRELNPKENADVEDAYRKAIAQAIGAIALILALYFTFKQYALATDAQRLATNAQMLAIKAQHLDQYQKGFDALKGTDVPAHVGGAYGLEILLHDVPEWRSSILMALSAAAVVFSHADKGSQRIVPDADAALLVVARNEQIKDGTRYPLARGHFPGARIPHANLVDANLDHVNLRGSDLYEANLASANLAFANLEGSNLTAANFEKARLVSANLGAGENLSDPHLQNGAIVASQLGRARFDYAKMSHAKLEGANLQGARFLHAVLEKAMLDKSCIDENTVFANTNLVRASFNGVWAPKAIFGIANDPEGKPDPTRRTSLTGASFKNAGLAGAKFPFAELSGANFSGADLTDVDFSNAQINGANFSKAHFCRTLMPDKSVRSESCTMTGAYPVARISSCPPQ